MHRLLLFAFLLISAGAARPAAAQSGTAGLPARPAPFKFVNDGASLLAPADAKKLESGLRRYADNYGTQVVVVTVPTLGGREVADYGRALGTAWGVGQRGKNNGMVVLIGAQEHKATIQAGAGLRSVITPEVTNRVLNQQMTPKFKQGDYFTGLKDGLGTLMLTANPSSNPGKQVASTGAAQSSAAGAGSLANASPSDNAASAQTPIAEPNNAMPTAEPASSGIGMGTLLIGALVIGGVLFLIIRMFRRKSADNVAVGPQASDGPNFYPNQPNRPNQPNQPMGGYGNQGPANYGGMPNQGGGSAMGGMGGMLATGAAAAAGAYLGNRMASGHGSDNSLGQNLGNTGGNSDLSTGAGAAAAGAAGSTAGGDYFSSRDGGGNADSAPDYFSDDSAANDSSGGYFSDDSNYNDTSSDDTGGGGFDDTDNNSGSW